MAGRKPRPAEAFATVSLVTVARELDVTLAKAAKIMRKYEYLGLTPVLVGRSIAYDAEAFDRVKALKDIPHRTSGSWLDDYLGEPHHG